MTILFSFYKKIVKMQVYNLPTLIKDSIGTSSISESPDLSISTVTAIGSPP